MNFQLKSWLPGIVQILVGLNNENQESHIEVNAEGERSKGAIHERVLIPLPMLILKGRCCPQTVTSDSISTKPQTATVSTKPQTTSLTTKA